MKSRVLTCAVTAACAASLLTPASADAAPSVKSYSRCTKVYKDYSGGLAKLGVTTNRLPFGSKFPLGCTHKHSLALYKKNRKRFDRDDDGGRLVNPLTRAGQYRA